MARRLSAFFATVFTACVIGPVSAQPTPPTFESVLEAAKKENGLVVRLSSPGRPQAIAALTEAFNKRFGLSVKPDWAPANAPATNTRVITEAGSGRGSIDIIGLGSAEDVSSMVSRNLVISYPWAEVFGKQLPGIQRAVDAVLPELRGQALPVLDAVYGLAWNPALIEESSLPKTTADLLDPKWQGKMAINSAFLNPLPSMAYVVGPEAMQDYASKLLRNKPVLEQGTPAVSRAISVGQVPFGVTTYHAALRTMQNGEPQKFRLFDDYVFVFEGYAYVPENAPNKNTARLFLAWLTTEGVAVANQHEALPLISDPTSDIAKLIAAQIARTQAKMATPTSLEQIKSTEQLRQTISKMISGQIAN
ncbi:ABC transporter substrate-binding protein [Microvirga puerhi]|uniref:Extracellular solute-binding protein n=1 Tax=Microvirga puerhi TaxID=2876078 RepID=A0ABS7VVB9_9HYPH|nr:extracellular solute-binding protein [Microvirga puerhi]MBZ6079075.1 extracellular solute-binding protein [Microvirga puerhi]